MKSETLTYASMNVHHDILGTGQGQDEGIEEGFILLLRSTPRHTSCIHHWLTQAVDNDVAEVNGKTSSLQLRDVSKPEVRGPSDNIRLALLTVQQKDLELVSSSSGVTSRGQRQPLDSHPSPELTEPKVLIERFYLIKIVISIHGKKENKHTVIV